MLKPKEMYFFKKTKKKGTMSIKFVGGTNEEFDLSINEIIFDADNTIEPISFYVKDGQQIISGTLFDSLKNKLLRVFKETIEDGDIGLYKYVFRKNALVEKL